MCKASFLKQVSQTRLAMPELLAIVKPTAPIALLSLVLTAIALGTTSSAIALPIADPRTSDASPSNPPDRPILPQVPPLASGPAERQERRPQQRGIASWYGPGFQGRPTASGERFNTNAMTAAHRHLPFGTRVQVTNLRNGRSVIVRINDRGPFIRGRIIDLSAAAARTLGLLQAGTAPVSVEIVE